MTDDCIHGVALDETCVLCCRTSARKYRDQRDDCKRDLEAANIEVAHLREAFVTMEKAYNALVQRTCDSCAFQRDDEHVGEPCCTISLTWIPCRVLGNTCGAYAKDWRER